MKQKPSSERRDACAPLGATFRGCISEKKFHMLYVVVAYVLMEKCSRVLHRRMPAAISISLHRVATFSLQVIRDVLLIFHQLAWEFPFIVLQMGFHRDKYTLE